MSMITKFKEGDTINGYNLKVKIGYGSYSQVWKCTDKDNNLFAMKIYKKGKSYSNSGLKEISILNKLRKHPNIITLYKNFKYDDHIILILELLGDNLYNVYKNKKCMDINIVKIMIKQLVDALIYMKCHDITHCDIKPENILFYVFKGEPCFKLIDFGCSEYNIKDKTNSYFQSRWYRAPEVNYNYGLCKTGKTNNHVNYSDKIDIWSLGCVVYEIVTGTPLFKGINYNMVYMLQRELYMNILINPNYLEDNLMKGFDHKLVNFIKCCLLINPKDRLNLDQASIHDLIKS